MRLDLSKADVERHFPWMVASLAIIFLGVSVVGLVDDVLSDPEVSAKISRVTRSANGQANVPVGAITADVRVSQTFRATEANLSEVAIMLATYGRRNHVSLVFSLSSDPPDGEPLRTVTVPPGAIADNAYHSFPFAPLTDSAGKSFTLTLESPQATPEDSFTAWLGECDCYPEGRAFLNGDELPQRDLAFRLGYHQDVTSVLHELSNRLSQYKPWFFKGGFLAVPGLTSLGLTLFAVGYFAAGVLDDNRRLWRWAWTPVWALVMAAVILWFVSQ